MHIGDIVFLPFEGQYIKYKVKKIVGDEILVVSFKDNSLNWLNISDVINLEEYLKITWKEVYSIR